MPRYDRTGQPSAARRRCRNSSAKGTRAEHELRDHLREKGCLVVNAKASKGPCDLLVLVPAATEELAIVGCREALRAHALLIEVKSGQQRVWGPARARLQALARRYGALALVACRADGKHVDERWTIEAA